MLFRFPLAFGIALLFLSRVDGDENEASIINGPTSMRVSSMDKCRRDLGRDTLTSLSGTVGMGWDNLRNLPLAMVLDLSYEKCATTPEGRWLIPDHMQIYPINSLKVDKMAEFYEHWMDHVQSRAYSINMDASIPVKGVAISGSFSATNEYRKEQFQSKKASLLHSQIEYRASSALMQSQTNLDPDLKFRLRTIRDVIAQGSLYRAKYLAELLLRDFGTHVITGVELGAKIEQEDYVDLKLKNTSESHFSEIRAAAAAELLKGPFKLGGGFSIKTSDETKEELKQATLHSRVITNGGPDVNRILNVDPKTNQSRLQMDELVVIDWSGVPLYTLINEATLPDFDSSTLTTITGLLLNATKEYYEVNKIEGCMDPRAANFDFRANVNGSCEQPVHNETFGGVFQSCRILAENDQDKYTDLHAQQHLCDEFIQKNGDTGDFSCGPLYEATLLLTTNYTIPEDKKPLKCEEKCSIFDGGFFTKKYNCRPHCIPNVFKYKAEISTYYCQNKLNVSVAKERGFLFGGLYSKNQPNIFTGSMSCPGYYQRYRIFRDTVICLSRNYAADAIYEVKVDRFFSCQTPDDEAKCLEGYTQHMAIEENDCDVYYCVKPDHLRSHIRVLIKRPPFTDPSVLGPDSSPILIETADEREVIQWSGWMIGLMFLAAVGLLISVTFVIIRLMRKQKNRTPGSYAVVGGNVS